MQVVEVLDLVADEVDGCVGGLLVGDCVGFDVGDDENVLIGLLPDGLGLLLHLLGGVDLNVVLGEAPARLDFLAHLNIQISPNLSNSPVTISAPISPPAYNNYVRS